MHPYRAFVADYQRLLEQGGRGPLGGFARLPRAEPRPAAPVALLFSPHPDDEVLVGGMALRLMREAGGGS